MNNLEQKIKDYFVKEEIRNNLDSLVQKYFKDEDSQKGFLHIFGLVKKGEFDIDDLYEYISDWLNIDIETAMKMDEELFDQVYGDIYDELQELYNQKSKQEAAAKDISGDISGDVSDEKEEKVGTDVGTSVPSSQDLMQKYNAFIQSSLFQNILASQEQVKEKYGNVETQHAASLPNDFYAAINAGDKIKVAGILRMICQQGRLRKFFKDDERYIDFFAGVLERHQGRDKREDFKRNPANKKYLIEFLKFILEKRVGFSNDEAVMLGVGLASLCRQSGEKEYEDMAYGDEGKDMFVWAI